jgi:hypothetical protein
MSDDKITSTLGLRPIEEAMEDSENKMETQLPANSFDTDHLPVQRAETLPAIPDAGAEENLKDIELAKKNIENIINLGDDAVKEMVEIAKQSESPRAFEVVSTLMKTLLDANKDYVDMSTKKRYAKEEHKTETNVTNNNLIVSTADLLKMIKGENE